MPELPDDLTELRDNELMDLYVGLVHWANHFNTQLALAEVEERRLDAEASRAEAIAAWRSEAKGVQAQKIEAKADPAVQVMQEEYEVKHAFRKIVQTLFENAERNSFVVSRELTRRVGMEPRQRRNDSWRP